MYVAESWKEGVKHVKNEWKKMNYKNPSDMDYEEMEKILFEVNHTHTQFGIDETGSVIQI